MLAQSVTWSVTCPVRPQSSALLLRAASAQTSHLCVQQSSSVHRPMKTEVACQLPSCLNAASHLVCSLKWLYFRAKIASKLCSCSEMPLYFEPDVLTVHFIP